MADTQETAKQKLSEEIEAAKTKLEALKRDLAAMHEEDKATLRERQAEIRAHLDAQRARAQELQAKMASWKNEKKQHTAEAIAGWKQRHEVAKLQRRAERAEDYAIDAVTFAAADFEEAEAAVYDALTARFEAEEAAAGA